MLFRSVDTQTSYVLLACLLAVLGGGLALVLPAMTEAVISHAPRAQSGIAAGMLNVSRQVGGVIGVAILGTLVGNQQTFLWGMHTAFVICGGVLILGLVSAWVFMSEHDRRQPTCGNSIIFGDACLLEQSERIKSESTVR